MKLPYFGLKHHISSMFFFFNCSPDGAEQANKQNQHSHRTSFKESTRDGSSCVCMHPKFTVSAAIDLLSRLRGPVLRDPVSRTRIIVTGASWLTVTGRREAQMQTARVEVSQPRELIGSSTGQNRSLLLQQPR